eukprot:CAMPEP_0172675982 /NCGR_PEP_ID=MMETSP1074-20121228/13639_1 /TAXON_ID=2916 /ORGANISM="Ceratium fusus, Strain PA161109" /LENGTH=73 /DNA_ID=CAMNT_0013493533 /DNA_START=60 /DNA_END=281 /DNA_ORIENTATION=-
MSVVFNVQMVCDGCSGAVSRILKKMDGVEEVIIKMEEQQVEVKGGSLPEKSVMLAKLKVWGEAADKAVSLAED